MTHIKDHSRSVPMPDTQSLNLSIPAGPQSGDAAWALATDSEAVVWLFVKNFVLTG